MRALLALPLLSLAAPAMAASGPFTVVETGRQFATLQGAVSAIGGGTGTIRVAPGTYRQCAVQTAGRVTFTAAQPGTAIFERTVCEDKAALVLRGSASRVEGLIFRGYRVTDGNGAGIRIETGDLTVVNSTFLDSQEGIIGQADGPQRIVIDRSTFAGLGQCDEAPNCAHSIYLGNRGSVTVTGSRFERGTGGHYVKLRSPMVTITGNSFDDSAGRKTNYMIDLPEGARGRVADNIFVQGPAKENDSAMVVVAAEAQSFPSDGLVIAGNDARLAPGAPSHPAFVADYSHQRIDIRPNRLGAGIRPFELR
jgi:hypothetical protein